MQEEWRAVISYEGLYEVSNLGRVKSLKRIREGIIKGTFHKVKEKIRKCGHQPNGYCFINLSKKGYKIKYFYIHRLVAQHFIDSFNELEVNHIDGNKGNNSASNLEFITHKENIKHATELGLRKNCGGKSGSSKLPITEIDNILSYVNKGLSFSAIGRIYSVDGRTIKNRLRKVTYTPL